MILSMRILKKREVETIYWKDYIGNSYVNHVKLNKINFKGVAS